MFVDLMGDLITLICLLYLGSLFRDSLLRDFELMWVWRYVLLGSGLCCWICLWIIVLLRVLRARDGLVCRLVLA